MDLEARRKIAACLRVAMSARAAGKEVDDFLELLRIWEYGLISGMPTTVPPIDPSRATGCHPA